MLKYPSQGKGDWGGGGGGGGGGVLFSPSLLWIFLVTINGLKIGRISLS